ncbi:MAG: hypothetical protein MZV65_47145 [Chromatiales bacterium]|nr:hypothetical protein [Chromatiales bacterium]
MMGFEKGEGYQEGHGGPRAPAFRKPMVQRYVVEQEQNGVMELKPALMPRIPSPPQRLIFSGRYVFKHQSDQETDPREQDDQFQGYGHEERRGLFKTVNHFQDIIF